jgi:asparaginyl-tRNA synthetase
LGSEHERYIAEKVYCRPTIVTNYPKGIKAFYMKLNDDNETVAVSSPLCVPCKFFCCDGLITPKYAFFLAQAMDILVPKIGELIGGSQRYVDISTSERILLNGTSLK